MSDNIQRKVLSNNGLKTNYVPNTAHKNKQQNQKRFSNISRQKQPYTLSIRQTIQKNTGRYYQQVDMQGSATIIPQKSSSRHNLYNNQNNNNLLNQISTHQRKQYQQTNLNIKSKSPVQRQQINHNLEMKAQNHHPLQQTNNNIPKGINLNQVNNLNSKQANGSYIAGGTKTLLTLQSKTQRQRQKNYQPSRQVHQDDINLAPSNTNQNNKIKTVFFNKIKQTLLKFKNTNQQVIDEDLMCDEEMDDLPVITNKKQTHQRRLSSNNYMTLGSGENKLNMTADDCYQTMGDLHSTTIDYNRTQKKQPLDKPSIALEKTKSEHTLKNKQPLINAQINNNCMQRTQTNSTSSKTHLNQVPNNPNFSALIQHTRNNSKITPQISYQQQLRRFSQIQQQINTDQYMESIFTLQNRQKQYMVQPNYIQNKQKNFNWSMRALLLQWMAHVCQQFKLKRATFYISLTLVDKYLEKTNDLPKSDFQLIGAACMFISSKLEEFECLQSAEFSKSTNNRYSAQEIRQTEYKICKTLNYELNPPTLYMWANSFMFQWDNYIQNTMAQNHPYFDTHQPKYFKKGDDQSYFLFRQMMQYLDCSILDIQTLQFAPKILVSSFMYLVLGKNYKQWPVKRIIQEFPRTSHYLVSEQEHSEFNHLFYMFLSDSFGLEMMDILPAVQYCSTYFGLQLNFDSPVSNQDQKQPMTLQQFQSFQTYNLKMHDYVKKRFRGLYL